MQIVFHGSGAHGMSLCIAGLPGVFKQVMYTCSMYCMDLPFLFFPPKIGFYSAVIYI